MPDASYGEALARLAGLLAGIPFSRERHVPAGKALTQRRLPVPPDVMEEIFWQAAGPLIGDGEPAAVMPAGMPAGTADGMLANLADTPANRAFSGSTGTADDSAPFPQLRMVAVTAPVKEGITLGFEDSPGRGRLPNGSGRHTSPGGAPPRPHSARTKRRSPAPGTGPAARSCGPARHGWPSRKPGPGRPPAALQARAESTPEIPSRLRGQDNRNRETPGHRVRARPLLNRGPKTAYREGRIAPHTRDRGRGTARPTRRDTRAAAMPGRKAKTVTRARTEHHGLKPPGSAKHLKSLVLRSRPREAAVAHRPGLRLMTADIYCRGALSIKLNFFASCPVLAFMRHL